MRVSVLRERIHSNNLFNFADDNTISAFSETVEGLINILQTETEKSLDWMENNDMIVNPDKFDAIILTKHRRDNTGIEITVNDTIIKSNEKVDLLGLTLDDKLSFEMHVSAICKKASGQFNALTPAGAGFEKLAQTEGRGRIPPPLNSAPLYLN